ncbi:nucleotidyltransferase domain-containing protein [Snodgrassella alvi]|uniref:nucleotidyltransferase domain-containing protein n=1 Tax=Snodgrassella alvi TaxID=1196083 RepID=UPI000C1F5BAD|nr:nucleotidyltransferase domain-containing protein [Snodgrassella alvi]PIT17951.1 nucleotidyltransferase [Snodgrassella alvi]PIT19182.1 nucleotidyltransferase [Snodgrassella alvi]
MHIYAFGSICRGEVDLFSDIDLLAIVNGRNHSFNPKNYSIYTYARINELWEQGNPFAWHLFLESRLIYSSDSSDYLRNLREPNIYNSGLSDCKKFHEIFLSAKNSIEKSNLTEIFDLSSIFLAVRNFATCYTLHINVKPDFSRNSARNLGVHSIPIDDYIYELLERARILCTRGLGELLSNYEIGKAKQELNKIEFWMKEKISMLAK